MDGITFNIIIRIVLGMVVLFYVGNCWTNQKYWSRKHFDWKSKEYWPEVFWLNIIGGILIGSWLFIFAFLSII